MLLISYTVLLHFVIYRIASLLINREGFHSNTSKRVRIGRVNLPENPRLYGPEQWERYEIVHLHTENRTENSSKQAILLPS